MTTATESVLRFLLLTSTYGWFYHNICLFSNTIWIFSPCWGFQDILVIDLLFSSIYLHLIYKQKMPRTRCLPSWRWIACCVGQCQGCVPGVFRLTTHWLTSNQAHPIGQAQRTTGFQTLEVEEAQSWDLRHLSSPKLAADLIIHLGNFRKLGA